MLSRRKPRIGLALGSGASRGWSHIGIIKALLAEDVHPDVVCGTSVGAIIGASYAAGNMQALEDWVLSSKRSDVLRFFDVGIAQSGFVDTKRLSWFLHNYVAAEEQRVEELPTKFAAVSTDLQTGREVWLTEGGVADAVRASMAMPGLFPAVRVDDRWLVDGGLVNPVPVTVCHALGADVVIAVNLNSGIVARIDDKAQKELPDAEEAKEAKEAEEADEAGEGGEETSGLLHSFKQQAREYSSNIFPSRESKDDAPGLFYAIAKSIDIFQDRITRSRLAGDPADVLLAPRVSHIGMLEFHRAEEAIEEGQRCVRAAAGEIRRVTGQR